MKAPADYVGEWIVNKINSGLESFLVDFITVFPILVGVSIGVYALVGMISKTLAKFGVGCVFLYGGLIILI